MKHLTFPAANHVHFKCELSQNQLQTRKSDAWLSATIKCRTDDKCNYEKDPSLPLLTQVCEHTREKQKKKGEETTVTAPYLEKEHNMVNESKITTVRLTTRNRKSQITAVHSRSACHLTAP